MKNEIRNGKVIGHRIYHQDRYTNKIGYLETKGTRVSYDKLELYLKENNKKFLYITKIGGNEKNTMQDDRMGKRI